ncbi:hypothetical protein AKJ09_07048 [Labilithrix luteola]|uniref:CDP-alcohol phosphatidyltransferase n=1 Tax=Labilithrix luteola TaxID=1391654 RepID=A0A0K1Q4R0_9BACT|nr:CDP-alcohol phosphatidyltransferase family protein [Labilithrix luteola]AKV00385.1 hypothetical protein AKJ09_07048 [Labilithrix luteola]
MNGRGFFDTEELAQLKQPHRPHTVDLSLISRLLEPFWKATATLVPPWVAPNAITLSGLALVVASFGSMLIANPTLTGPAPKMVHVFAIVAIFAFQTLDALDGKQARKTKSSSALGNWCDHACDVAAIQMAMTTVGGAIGLGTGGALLFLLGSVIVNNYVIHWETRHTGTLYMGNGTSIYEAQLMMMAIHAITLGAGVELWGRPLGSLVPFAAAVPFASAPLRLWLVVVGVGAIGGVGMIGSLLRVARSGRGGAVFLELVNPFALCLAASVAVCSAGHGMTLPFVFSASLLGLHLIARQILGQLVGSQVKVVDPKTVPLIASGLAMPFLSGPSVVSALGWANLVVALGVGLSTYLGATFAIARALELPILTLPKRLLP